MGARALPVWLGPGAAAARGVGRFLDYTLLQPEATREDIMQLCDAAAAGGVHAVCVNGAWVAPCVRRLRGTGVLVAAVVDFPLGAASGAAKAAEAVIAVADGATELDMVIPLGAAKAGDWTAVTDDVAQVAGAAGAALVKAIIESAILTPDEITRACQAAVAGGAGFVKTSTGFHPSGGATVAAVRQMRAAVDPGIGVKASGGIRTAGQALAMLAAGASRIGLSKLAGLDAIVGPTAPPLVELLGRAAADA
ncbi:MAG: deoxyribose-phosphate aldolase [Deltaproteobacteria bacterium]